MEPLTNNREYTPVKVRGEIFAQKKEKAQQMRARLVNEVEVTPDTGEEDETSSNSKIVLRIGNLPDEAREDVNLVLRKHNQSRRRKVGTVATILSDNQDQLNTKL